MQLEGEDLTGIGACLSEIAGEAEEAMLAARVRRRDEEASNMDSPDDDDLLKGVPLEDPPSSGSEASSSC